MDTSLFNDLYNIINMPSLFELEETEFFFFLLGGYSETDLYEYEKIKILLENNKSKPYISLRSLLGRKYSKSLDFHRKQTFTLNDLIEIRYPKDTPQSNNTKKAITNKKDEISNLYAKFHISIPNKQDTEHLLLRLFSICLIGRIPKLFASYENQKLKPATIKSTLGRNNDEKKLYKMLNQHNKVIVSGEHGIGKTHFIKYCLNTWKKDFCYICYEISMDNTLRKIRYTDINGYEYEDASDSSLFNEQFSSSLLIIDNMSYSDNFYDDLKYLAQMSINIIIITTASIPQDIFHGFCHYKLPLLPENILYKIFENNSGLSLTDPNLKKSLSSYTLNNTLLVSLIASQCKKLHNSPSVSQNSKSIIETVLSQLEHLNKHMDFNTSDKNTFKHQYNKKTLNLLGHIKSVYNTIWNSSEENVTAKEFMKLLCLFGWSPIPIKFIEHVLPSYDNKVLLELTKMGLIMVTGEYVQIPSLLSHAFFASEILSPIAYKEIVSSLSKFLYEYDQTLDVPYLSDALFIFFISLYEDIPAQNNPSQSTTADYFESWQQLGYLIINYYNQNGAPKRALKVNETIKYPDTLKNRHNAFDKQIMTLNSQMQTESESDNMVSHIDHLIHTLDTTILPNESPIIQIPLILNALDTALNRLCLLFLDMTNISDSAVTNCLYVLKEFLTSTPKSPSLLSNEQLLFYQSCYSLITAYLSNNFNVFQRHYLYNFSSIKNKNYTLCALAFFIFWQSHYTYVKRNENIFKESTIQYISQLNCLISDCELIPAQTFRLCLSSYIKAAMVQHTFISCGALKLSESIDFFNINILRNLFIRCNLTKNNIDEITENVESVLSIIQNDSH